MKHLLDFCQCGGVWKIFQNSSSCNYSDPLSFARLGSTQLQKRTYTDRIFKHILCSLLPKNKKDISDENSTPVFSFGWMSERSE